MKQSDIAGRVAAEVLLSKADAEVAVNAVLETISDAVARGESVSISGFGTFSSKHREAPQGRNPCTGEPIEIAAMAVLSFTAAKSLREGVC